MKVGVLASHEGTTLQSLLDACSDGRIQAHVAVVVSNNSDSGALRRARQAGVQAVHLSSTTHPDPAALDAAIRGVLAAADVDVVFLAGYMKKLGPLVLSAFEHRILNTHPALLPRFGGPGMYGYWVFEAVLEAGDAESGISIHRVDADYDTGAIVRQCTVPVFRGDSLNDLKARVRAREKEFVVETLGQIAKGDDCDVDLKMMKVPRKRRMKTWSSPLTNPLARIAPWSLISRASVRTAPCGRSSTLELSSIATSPSAFHKAADVPPSFLTNLPTAKPESLTLCAKLPMNVPLLSGIRVPRIVPPGLRTKPRVWEPAPARCEWQCR